MVYSLHQLGADDPLCAMEPKERQFEEKEGADQPELKAVANCAFSSRHEPFLHGPAPGQV
jgi:hypothetical protein